MLPPSARRYPKQHSRALPRECAVWRRRQQVHAARWGSYGGGSAGVFSSCAALCVREEAPVDSASDGSSRATAKARPAAAYDLARAQVSCADLGPSMTVRLDRDSGNLSGAESEAAVPATRAFRGIYHAVASSPGGPDIAARMPLPK
ncbi:hypothetical protein GQ53DRAFT_24097 [Thozetella sp. PMI_491]|nr:hypothetical protein GQ53DRAFT_24097 [Thozetella sp. PMI_491]